MATIVTSYINPDLDGVACAMALCASKALRPHDLEAQFSGQLNDETLTVLDYLGLNAPATKYSATSTDTFWLVDTHHPQQLDAAVDKSRVSRIVDHHPSGSAASFVNARIDNQMVGAAATLVAEHLYETDLNIDQKFAMLLAAAIYSNTLNFRAPSTTDRDKLTYDRLTENSGLPDRLTEAMNNARDQAIQKSTLQLITQDVKMHHWRGQDVAVAQTELAGALSIASRPDLVSSVYAAKTNLDVGLLVWNLADLNLETSAFVTVDDDLMKALAPLASRRDQHILWVSELALRKTHLFPQLEKTDA